MLDFPSEVGYLTECHPNIISGGRLLTLHYVQIMRVSD